MNPRSITFLVLLVASNLAIVISLSTPYWIGAPGSGLGGLHTGLWVNCIGKNCSWLINLQDWAEKALRCEGPASYAWTAAQVLMPVSFVLAFIPLLITSVTYCVDKECPCCNCWFRICLCNYVMTSSLDFCCLSLVSTLTAVGLQAKSSTSEETLKWSYWLACAAAVGIAICALIHHCKDGSPPPEEDEGDGQGVVDTAMSLMGV